MLSEHQERRLAGEIIDMLPADASAERVLRRALAMWKARIPRESPKRPRPRP